MRLSPRYEGPPIVSIAGSPDDQLAPLLRQRRRLEATLVDLDEDEWRAATRCADWTVHDVVAHLISVNAFWQMSVLAGLAGSPTRVLVDFDPAATPPLMVAPMRALAPAEILDQFVASNNGFLEAIAGLDTEGWETLAETPAGHVPVRLLAFHALWDSWVHERDIALPRGFTPPIEADEVLSCLRYAAAVSPALAIGTGTAVAGVFRVDATDPELSFAVQVGQSVAVRDGSAPADAPCLRGAAVALVEALSIRAPLPASTPPEWHHLLEGLATAFDSEPAIS
jgi:uncharacterized protein (TIGR03083 family)